MRLEGGRAKFTVPAGMASLILAAAALAQTGHGQLTVSAVRHWNTGGVTRVAIEVSGEFQYKSDRLENPDRVYYDIQNARPRFSGKRLFTEDLKDPFVKRIRVAETTPGVTRVVLDLSGGAQVNASILSSPDRLIVELRGASSMPTVTTPASAVSATSASASSAGAVAPLATSLAAPASQASVPAVNVPATAAVPTTVSRVEAPIAAKSVAAGPMAPAARPNSAAAETTTSAASEAVTTVASTNGSAILSTPPATTSVATPGPSMIPKPARHTTSGDTSLVRTLGLKLQRVVIDPGHGGHDEGTQGPHGLLEKDLVLDVSLRLGKLIEEKLGAEVVYTRSDDTFIPLEGRTALANEKKADLFLSIHANSSPISHITGVESYYLNFTDSKDAMDVAARENAGSGESISDLRDLIQKISLHDKASESRDFAERIQAALFAFSSKNFPTERNRGVKKAPFVVLIGANMPSVLAEIGFVSNPREEALLKRSEYRQKLAEALFNGVSKYAQSLSHFQMAAN